MKQFKLQAKNAFFIEDLVFGFIMQQFYVPSPKQDMLVLPTGQVSGARIRFLFLKLAGMSME
jgi:hypothetical protein